jgi:hypothetical protein
MSITASKNDLAHELFVRTADENYVAARWCAMNRLNADFLWLALHALEKYLKAVLLVNGRNTQVYGHNIVCLYEVVKQFAAPLLPDRLERPADLDIYLWHVRSPDDFMKHLLRYGNADNRYAIYGYVTSSQDLHMLDEMVFSVRRLVCGLDERMLLGRDPQLPTVTHRDVLTRQPAYYGRIGMPLDKLIASPNDTPLRRAALNLNLPFAPKDYQHEPFREGISSSNPVIIRRILDPLASDDPRRAKEGVEIASWFLDNVQVPKDVAGQIDDAIKAARAKHGLH